MWYERRVDAGMLGVRRSETGSFYFLIEERIPEERLR
jgi:hypothetical protein